LQRARNNGDIDTVDGFGLVVLSRLFRPRPVPPRRNWRNHGTFKACRYKLTRRFSPSSRSSSSSSSFPWPTSSRSSSYPAPSAASSRETVSSKWATHLNTLWQSRLALEAWDSARAEEGANERGERPGDKGRNEDEPRGRRRRRRLVAPCPSSVSRSSGCSECTSTRLFRSRPLDNRNADGSVRIEHD